MVHQPQQVSPPTCSVQGPCCLETVVRSSRSCLTSSHQSIIYTYNQTISRTCPSAGTVCCCVACLCLLYCPVTEKQSTAVSAVSSLYCAAATVLHFFLRRCSNWLDELSETSRTRSSPPPPLHRYHGDPRSLGSVDRVCLQLWCSCLTPGETTPS